MSITNRTLAQAMTVSDLTATLDSATGTLTGYLVLIGTEYMLQTGPAVGTVIPVRRGQIGSAQLAHAVSAGVQVGPSSDFPATSPVQASVFTDDTLTGNGTSADPLSVVGGGTVVVDSAGALTGDGSALTPLAVAVDGSSVTIVGNVLTAPGGGSGTVTHTTGALTSGAIIIGNGSADVKPTTTGVGIVTALGVAVGSAGAPVINGGALGTPSSGTLTSATGLPVSTGLTGAGTGVLTALGVNVGSAGAVLVNGGVLGTPSSGTATNITGLPEAGLSLTDVTTNNTSTSKHGFAPKLDNNVLHFLNGQGGWTTPAGSGSTTLTVLTADPTPADDIAWIVRSGTSPGDSITLKVQVNGTIYELAGVTIS